MPALMRGGLVLALVVIGWAFQLAIPDRASALFIAGDLAASGEISYSADDDQSFVANSIKTGRQITLYKTSFDSEVGTFDGAANVFAFKLFRLGSYKQRIIRIDAKTRKASTWISSTGPTKLDCESVFGQWSVTSRGTLVVQRATRTRRECGAPADTDYIETVEISQAGNVEVLESASGPAHGDLSSRVNEMVSEGQIQEIGLEANSLMLPRTDGISVADRATGRLHSESFDGEDDFRVVELSTAGRLLVGRFGDYDTAKYELVDVATGNREKLKRAARLPSDFATTTFFCGDRIVTLGRRGRNLTVYELVAEKLKPLYSGRVYDVGCDSDRLVLRLSGRPVRFVTKVFR